MPVCRDCNEDLSFNEFELKANIKNKIVVGTTLKELLSHTLVCIWCMDKIEHPDNYLEVQNG